MYLKLRRFFHPFAGVYDAEIGFEWILVPRHRKIYTVCDRVTVAQLVISKKQNLHRAYTEYL